MVGICKDEDLNQYISFHPIHVSVCIFILDQGSIRSNLRDGLVLPVLNLSILDAGSLIRCKKVRLMIFLLNMVDYPMPFFHFPPNFFGGQVESKNFLLFEFFSSDLELRK